MSQLYGFEHVEHPGGLPFHLFMHKGEEIAFHWHGELEILMVLKGKINVRIDSCDNHLSEDDIIIINSYTPHYTMNLSDEPAVISGLHIDTRHYSNYLDNFNQKHFLCKSFLHGKYFQQHFAPIRSAIARIFLEYSLDQKKGQLISEGLVNLLCFYIDSSVEYITKDSVQRNVSDEDYNKLIKIVDFIKANIDKKITLESVSKEINISKYYLSHFFKEHMGIGFKSYIQHIRLDKAVYFLLHTDNKIIDIALDCGFSSIQHFYQFFKGKYNCTPAEYRDRYLKNENYSIGNSSEDLYIFKKLTSYLDREKSGIAHLIRDEYKLWRIPFVQIHTPV